MQRIFYIFFLPVAYFLSFLPEFLLYGLSDVLFVVSYFLLSYRKKTVRSNLTLSFPELSKKEILTLERKFYRYMGDLFLETLKTLTISRKTMLKKCSLTPETKALFDHYAKNKKSLILVLGHHGNWEWAGNAFGLQCKQPLYVIYHPLSNKPFNSLVIKMRTRFGTRLIEMKSTLRDMIAKRGEVNVTAFIADQSPTPEGAYWTTFLNQDTPIFKGAEKIARKLEYPVVYVSLDRYKRGYYKVNAQVLFENPGLTKENEISEKHTRILEKEILRQPETWLWSHRRWKHKRPAA